MSSIDITGIIDKMTELYADEFDEFELTSSDNGLICRTVDIYNIENKCLYRINADVSEEELTEDIRIWLDKLVRCSKNVVRLNNWLEDKSNGFNIQYRFIQEKRQGRIATLLIGDTECKNSIIFKEYRLT